MEYNRIELEAALDALAAIAYTKPYVPILGSVLVEENARTRLTGVGQSCRLSISVAGDLAGSSPSFCVPLAWLKRAVHDSKREKMVSLDCEKNTATFRAGGNSTSIATLTGQDFPSVAPAVSEGDPSIYDTGLEIVLEALHCYSRDKTRETLNRLHFDAEARRGVATDGHRLSLVSLPASWQLAKDMEIPGAAIPALLCLARSRSELPIVHQATHNGCAFTGDSWTLTCSLSHGGFPSWRQVMPPDGSGSSFRVERKRLIEALKRLPKRTKHASIGITCTVQGSELKIEYNDLANDVSSSGIVPLEAASFSEAKFHVSPAYLKQSLEALPTGTVIFTVPGGRPEACPVMLKAGQQVDLIMQMRV